VRCAGGKNESGSLAVLSIVFVTAPTVRADEVSCDAVRTVSKLGINRANRVGTSADSNAQVCRFSIDGAGVGSPPQESVMKALDMIDKQKMRELLANKDVDALAFALLAASSDKAVPQELRRILSDSAKDIGECFAAFDQHKPSYDGLSGDDVMCKVVPGGSTAAPKLHGRQSVQFARSLPSILVGAAVGSVQHYLSVPQPPTR
jgi:hypothetical protein